MLVELENVVEGVEGLLQRAYGRVLLLRVLLQKSDACGALTDDFALV